MIVSGNVGIGTTAPGAKLEVAGNINSSPGALQTAGVTRIDNSGVGTFAAGTTIGGSAVTAAVVDNSLANGRLTLTSGTPVTTSDVTAATTLYYTPYNGNRISLYDGTSAWTTLTFNELSLALTNYTANSNYDIWAYNNSGTVALESTIWTNNTTRATAITQQNGVWVKSGATTRRLLGTIRITGTTGQTEDSRTKRFISNVYGAQHREFWKSMSWQDYSCTTGYWGNDSTQKLEFVKWNSAVVLDITNIVNSPNQHGGTPYLGLNTYSGGGNYGYHSGQDTNHGGPDGSLARWTDTGSSGSGYYFIGLGFSCGGANGAWYTGFANGYIIM
jgi:hypothetical protein